MSTREPYFEKRNGLIVAIIQDWRTKQVLMQGFMNKEAWRKTLETGEVWFWSTTRQKLWHKGETSGNRLLVKNIWLDCDGDAVVILARALGPICHTGKATCFFNHFSRPRRK